MHEFSFTCNAVCVHAICEGLLEDSSPLQLKMKQQKGGFRSMLLNAFCASLLGNLLPDKWVIWVGDGVIRARQDFNPLGANPTKCSNTLKQILGNLPTNCLSVFDYFLILALKGFMMSHLLTNFETITNPPTPNPQFKGVYSRINILKTMNEG